MMDENPYASPNIPTESAPPKPGSREIYLAWEKLRLPYNIILIAELTYLTGLQFTHATFLAMLIQGLIGWNICFYLGWIAERAGSDGKPNVPARICLFLAGLLFSVFVVLICVFTTEFGPF